MSERRNITLQRASHGRYVATNRDGVTLEFGHGEDVLSPVELLLAAIGGCSAIDVDFITSKRDDSPEEFVVDVSAAPVKDDNGGHRMDDVVADFRIRFADTDSGRQAAEVVERSIAQSRDRLCTVSRTVAAPTRMEFRRDGEAIA